MRISILSWKCYVKYLYPRHPYSLLIIFNTFVMHNNRNQKCINLFKVTKMAFEQKNKYLCHGILLMLR